MADNEALSTSDLTPSENRVRVVVEKHLNDVMNQSYDSLEKALNDLGADFSKRLNERLEEQNELSKKLREDQKEREKKLREHLDRIESKIELKPITGPTIPLPQNLSKVVPIERQAQLGAGLGKAFERLENKNAKEAQRVMYEVGDELVKLTSAQGEPVKFVHLEKKKVVLGAGACVAVGIGLGVGGTLLMTRREQKKAGYTRQDYKAWISAGPGPAKPPKLERVNAASVSAAKA